MQQYIAYTLIGAGALWLIVGLLMKRFYDPDKGRMTFSDPSPTVVKNSDAPAPVGIGPYVSLVEKASPTATAETRWGYVAAGLTEAEVLRLEVDRLGKAST